MNFFQGINPLELFLQRNGNREKRKTRYPSGPHPMNTLLVMHINSFVVKRQVYVRFLTTDGRHICVTDAFGQFTKACIHVLRILSKIVNSQ